MSKEEQRLNVEELNRELADELEVTGEQPPDRNVRRHRHSRRRRRRVRKKRKITPFRVLVALLCFLLVLFAGAAGTLFYFYWNGEKEMKTVQVAESEPLVVPEKVENVENVEDDGKTVVYKGVRYCYNEDIVTILCMGIDTLLQETGELIGANGQADTVVLAALDTATGRLSLINISREAMVDVNLYDTSGGYVGSARRQLCLAYTYGDGKEKSCENVARSVSRLMYGIPVNAYAAIDYSAISVLNDAVGGVTVEVLEDLTRSDPELTAGRTLTLQGEQAHSYVRDRNMNLLKSNEQRMARQRQYLLAFVQQALSETKADIMLPLTLYQEASQYMVTDIGPSKVTYLASKVLGTGFSESDMYSVPGETIDGGEYAEFIPDDEGLYELILNVFYKEE